MKQGGLNSSARSAAASRPLRILVVDDDPFVRSVTVGALAGGAIVKACGSGEEALAVAADFQPMLVLMDWVMPGMDGRATWEALCEILMPAPPVVFLTARDDPQSRDDIRALGALGVIAKPFDPVTLANDVRRLARLNPIKPASAEDRLAALGEKFRRSLGSAAEGIEGAWGMIYARGWQRELAESVLDRVHKLAGSAGLFHLSAVGGAANECERLFLAHIRLDRAPTDEEMEKLDAATRILIAACKEGRASAP